jgi:hypothetical protein
MTGRRRSLSASGPDAYGSRRVLPAMTGAAFQPAGTCPSCGRPSHPLATCSPRRLEPTVSVGQPIVIDGQKLRIRSLDGGQAIARPMFGDQGDQLVLVAALRWDGAVGVWRLTADAQLARSTARRLR